MRLSGRITAAIEILTAIAENHRPAKHALSDWGRANRYAGSKDRAAIGNLVYDCLRNRSALCHRMNDESPRALALAAVTRLWGEHPEALAASFREDRFAPAPITEAELKQLAQEGAAPPPEDIAANMPGWLFKSMEENFGPETAAEGAALAARAPLDIRTNTGKATREKLAKALARYKPEATAFAPTGLRIPAATKGDKAPNIEAEAAHGKGWFEIQDEGSQIASLLTGAKPGDQVLDYCAGAGGKTLALSAQMNNTGQIHAYDNDKHRLRPIFERLKRAGCRNVQTIDAGNEAALGPLEGTMDVVLVDAPCTGSGTWRRHPDAKWRLSEEALATRLSEQRGVLTKAAPYVKPGGRLVYVTCSLLPAENQHQISEFIKQNSAFSLLPFSRIWAAQGENAPPLTSADGAEATLTLTPRCHNTDGFFIAILQKSA